MEKIILTIIILIGILSGPVLATWVYTKDGKNFEIVEPSSTNAMVANYASSIFMTMNQINAMAQTNSLPWIEIRSAAEESLNKWSQNNGSK